MKQRKNNYIVIAYVDNEFVTSHHERKELAEAQLMQYAYYSEYDAILLDEYMNVIKEA